MKKVIILIVLMAVIFSVDVFAVSYGARIPRFQTFPGESTVDEIAQAKENIVLEGDATILKLEDLSKAIDNLRSDIDKVSVDANSARTETNVQQSNILNSISALKTQLDELRELKNLREELLPSIEQPREIITPKVLLMLSGGNLLFSIILISLVLFVKRDHEVSHKMSPHGHPELHEYIKQHITKGVNINNIRHQLISHDWDPEEVDQAITEVKES